RRRARRAGPCRVREPGRREGAAPMLEVIAVLALAGGDGGFFERREVDFWNSRRKTAGAPAELWADSTAPPPVRKLLEAPSVENARAYLAWQEERLRKLR